MIGVYLTVPIACFRKGLAREYLETEPLPPPATAYGFLLSLVGESDRMRHIGARVTAALVGSSQISVVLRTVWRVKNRPLGSAGNTRPDYQQLLTGAGPGPDRFLRLVLWLDSAGERTNGQPLEDRVRTALDPRQRHRISRFGGLSLGESTHLVDEVCPFSPDPQRKGRVFLLKENGLVTLPVWVDHVGSTGTRYVTGELVEQPLVLPRPEQLPVIEPKA